MLKADPYSQPARSVRVRVTTGQVNLVASILTILTAGQVIQGQGHNRPGQSGSKYTDYTVLAWS